MMKYKLSYLYCFTAIALFSTIELFGKLIGKGIHPLGITAYRFIIGGLVLLPFAIHQYMSHQVKLRVRDFLIMAYPGILNVAISMMFLQLGVYYGKASVSAILVATNPLFVAIFGYLLLDEKPDRTKMLGVFFGLFGIFLIIFGEQMLYTKSTNMIMGIVFGALASVTFGLYTILSKKYIVRYGNFLFNTVTFMSGAVVLLAAGFIMHIPLMFHPGVRNLLCLGYLGIFVTGIAYILFFEGLKNIPAVSGSMFFFLKPVLASFLAVIILREHLSATQIAGIVVIVFALSVEYQYKMYRSRSQGKV